MVEIVHKNVDKTASLAAKGLMESVNLAAIQDGKGPTVTQVMTFIVIPLECIFHKAMFIKILFFFNLCIQLLQCSSMPIHFKLAIIYKCLQHRQVMNDLN